ncbi:MAG: hypothetical protein EP338_09415 [Bacteroidetes bacterium]|nr:MAG: hypothetical protein EP338_09415 [Bacteroidota bacterium]
MIKGVALFIPLFFLFACETSSKKREGSINSGRKDLPDSVRIRKLVLEQYLLRDTVLNQATAKMEEVRFQSGDIACQLELNGDSFPDYFVVTHDMGGPTSGHFHDGKTGAEIPLTPEHEYILSRPGVDIEHRILQINSSDGHKELLVRTGGGGTLGNYFDCTIYRYDRSTAKMKAIFQENISSFVWEDNLKDEKKLAVNYIDANYPNKSSYDTIRVRPGKLISSEDRYSIQILPLKAREVRTYVFHPEENQFKEITK